MTMREMALAIVAHEDERRGTQMSEAQIRRKAASLVELFDRNPGLGRKAGLQEWYELEMAH
jgi:hypothetical protein